ncbi:MAG: type II secretion system minor pseudopilin GspJ [Alphaproteobacteria bacterium]|nr:type II secretion system minor pseudopilin GspJ [Alphaproteobacteria bacterium]
MMVALFIFGVLAAAGVMLLSNSVTAQGVVKAHLDDMALIQRASAAMTADLAQASPRISRNEDGKFIPAFWAQSGDENQPLVRFVRGGWSNLDSAPRSTLQKIEYWYADGSLERRSYPMLDGAVADEPSPMLEGIDVVTVRYRDAKGDWRDNWQPTQPDLLPRAVEMQITRENEAPLTLLFLVGPGAKAVITGAGQ